MSSLDEEIEALRVIYEDNAFDVTKEPAGDDGDVLIRLVLTFD